MPRVPMTQATLDLIASYLVQREPSQSPSPRTPAPDPGPTASNQAGVTEVLYARSCSPCHGVRGAGDGYNAPFLPVRPTAHADATYMSRRSDDALFDAIYAGGYIMNRSNRMPPFGHTLAREQIWSLVRYLADAVRAARGLPGRAITDEQEATASFRSGPGRTGRRSLSGRAPSERPACSRRRTAVLVAGVVSRAHRIQSRRPSHRVPGPEAPGAGRPASRRPISSGPRPVPHAIHRSTPPGSPPRTDAPAGRRAGLAKGPFNGRPMRFRDAVVTPSTTAGGAFVFTVAQQDRPTVVFQVDAVVGGGFMVGGGTQAAFSKFPDGTLRFLPFDYSQAEHLWFCQARPGNRGWIPITPAIALADCDAWPPTRILGSSERFQSCQQCHGSQIEVAFDSVAQRYDTRYTTLAINCESCHGPGRRHVEIARSGKMDASADIGMRSLATLTKDQSLEVCFQCHSVKAALEPGYLPGKRLEGHFSLKLPQVLDSIYYADGRTRVFAYQEGHLSSDCYLNGSMTCVDCHDPHSQRYRDINSAPLPGRFDDGQCLDCHASKAEPLERHTRHPPSSPGSRCVSCHMPYLQESSVGGQIRYARSDHTIPIPRPAFDTRLGIENACQQCHRSRTAEQLEAQVTAWYGQIKPHAARGRRIARRRQRERPGPRRPHDPVHGRWTRDGGDCRPGARPSAIREPGPGGVRW